MPLISLAFLVDLWQLLVLCSQMGGWPRPDGILEVPEAAQLLKVAEKNVYAVAQKNQPTAFKPGGNRRFLRLNIYQWIKQQKARARDERTC